MRAKPIVVAAREEKRERACRHGEIIRVALLETERARRVAAEMLEGESGEDRRGGDDEHHRAGPQHHPRRPRQDRLAGRIHLRRHIWR